MRGVKKKIKDNKCRPTYSSNIYTHRHSRIIIIIVSFHTFWKTLKTTRVREYYIPTTWVLNFFFFLFVCLSYRLSHPSANPRRVKYTYTHTHTTHTYIYINTYTNTTNNHRRKHALSSGTIV